MAYAIPAMHLTEAGKALYAKVHNGAPLRFTRVAVGDGYITEDTLDITQLVSPVDATVDTLEKQVMPDGTFRMAVRIYSADKDFYLREVGIMAYDPDDGEILYAYSNYGDNADYITTYSGSYPVTQDIDIYVDIGATENVSVDITGITNVTWDDIKDKLEQREVSSLPTTCTEYDFAEDIVYEGIERCTVEYDQENDRLEIDSASNAGNKYGMAAADLSGILSNVNKASIEFDVFIPAGSRWYVSLVNLAVRPGESSKITYDTVGVAIYFGTKDGDTFLLNGDDASTVPLDTWLHFSALFDNKLKAVTYEIKNKDTGTSYMSGELDYLDYTCAEITAIEVYTWSQSNLKIANTLSVTLGDTPSNNIRYIVEEDGYRNEYIYINGTPVRIGSTAVTEIPELSEKAHTHENKTVLDGVSSEKMSNWDAAYSQRHTHSNKSVLDGISSSDISNWDGKANTNSPTFSGTPKAPTPDTSDNSTQIATTAFVFNKIQEILSLSGVVTLKSIGINFSWSLGSHGTDTVGCNFQYINMQNEDITDWYTDISECSFGVTTTESTTVRALWIGISKYNKSVLKVILADGTVADAGSSSLPEGYNFTCVARSLTRPSTYKGLYTLTDGTITAQSS